VAPTKEWNLHFRRAGHGKYPMLTFTLPAPLGRAIMDAGLWAVTVSVTDEGLLLRPMPDDPPGRNGRGGEVELPDGWKS
jgi:hypothetical protein